MMFITDGYAGLQSESFRGCCCFLEECTSITLLCCAQQALVFCNRQVTELELNSRMLYNDLVWHNYVLGCFLLTSRNSGSRVKPVHPTIFNCSDL